jgi:tmRNA-binding protein
MSKNQNSFLGRLIMVSVFFAGVLFIYVFALEEVKSLSNEKKLKENLLVQKNNELELIKVDIQKLSSEKRIVELALNNLGLVRSSKQFDKLQISKNKVNQIENLVNNKYD